MGDERKRHKPQRERGEGGLFAFQHRGKERWRATKPVKVTYTTAQGETRSTTKVITGTGDTRSQARERLQANLNRFHQQPAESQAGNRRNPATIEGYYTGTFLKSKRASEWKPGTRRGFRQRIEQHVLPEIGTKTLTEITRDDVRKIFVTTLPNKGLSAATQVNTYRGLYTLFEDAKYDGKITVNPMTLIRPEDRPKRKELEDIDLPVDIVTKIQKTVAGTENEALRMLSMMLGLRGGELLGLTWDCVTINSDPETPTGRLRIKQQLKHIDVPHGEGCKRTTAGHFECGKQPANCPKHPEPVRETGLYIAPWTKTKPRTVALVQPLISLLIEQKKRQEMWRYEAGEKWQPINRPKMDNLIFTTKEGKPLRPQNVGEDWKKLLAECGFGYIEPHKSRYIAATSLLLNGTPLAVTSAILGHADSRITERIYTQISAGDQAKHLTTVGVQFNKEHIERQKEVTEAYWKRYKAAEASISGNKDADWEQVEQEVSKMLD